MKLGDVRLIIPTHNRPECLSRLLSYYTNSDIAVMITVADSSSDDTFHENERIIAAHSPLSVIHDRYASEINPHYKFGEARKRTSEQYSIMCADDDFIPPEAISAGLKFLTSHPDFTLVHGKYLVFHRSKVPKQLHWQPIYRHQTLNNTDPLRRMYRHITHYYPIPFGLWRTRDAQIAYAALTENNIDPILWGELLPSFLMPLFGKVKVLNTLWSLRDGEMTGKGSWPTLQTYQQDGRFEDARQKMREAAISIINTYVPGKHDQAVITFDTALSVYTSNLVSSKNRQPLQTLIDRIRVRIQKEFISRRFFNEIEKVRSLVVE